MSALRIATFLMSLAWATLATGATRHVGPGQAYATPCAAIAAAGAGDTILIEASGSYAGDVCAWSTSGLTIQGVNGRPHIDAAGQNAQGKATWVISGDDTTIDTVELSGATAAENNGAGIRQEGRNLTIRNVYFHDNQNGILAGDLPGSTITIERSEFRHNGSGSGLTHNLYINHVDTLIFRYNWSHDAVVGHLLKSRARQNVVLYNRLTGEAGSSDSYELSFPSGGAAYVIGNVVEQPASSPNGAMLDYMSETGTENPDLHLFVVNNTFVNDRGAGTFLQVGQSAVPILARNNIFWGAGTVTNQGTAVLDTNYTGSAALFVDPTHYDYHLLPGTPAVDASVAPGFGGSESLVPTAEYAHPTGGVQRRAIGPLDLGAFELDVGTIFADSFDPPPP